MEFLDRKFFRSKDFWIYLFIFLFSLFLLRYLFCPGIYTAHDIWHNLARLNYYFQALKEGQFPPYYLSNAASGFGYPLFLFSYHLPWIFGSIFMFFGLSDVSVIKILFFLSFFLSGVTMYLLAFELSRRRYLSLVASLLYLIAPYRFLIIFVSAAVGISFTFIFIPLIVLGLLRIQKGRLLDGELLMAFGLSGVILSHFPTLIVFLPSFFFLSLYFLFKSKFKIKFLKTILFSVFLSLGISSFYLFPAFYYENYILGLPRIFEMGFVNLSQLIYSKWGFGIIVKSASENPFSFQIGIAQWLIFLFSLLVVVLGLLRSFKFDSLVLFLILAFLINIFFTNYSSSLFWEKFISKTGLDFPFRFIYPNVFLTSLLFVLLAKEVKSKVFYYIFPFLILFVAFYTNRNHIRPNMFLAENEFRPFIESELTTNKYSEYFPKGASLFSIDNKLKERIINESQISLVSESINSSKYKILFDEEKSILLPKFNYPFVSVLVDGVYVKQDIKSKPFLKVVVPKSSHEIEVIFKRTLVINVSLLTTLISLSLFSFLIWKSAKVKDPQFKSC